LCCGFFFNFQCYFWKAVVVLFLTLKRFQITFIVENVPFFGKFFYARQINMSNFVSMNDNMSNWCLFCCCCSLCWCFFGGGVVVVLIECV